MKNKKILIADDNALNRRVFQNIIGQVYIIDIAENGFEVLEKIKKEHFDLILLDVQMPLLDGINTLKTIRDERLSSSPIVAVSAFAGSEDRDFFLSAGFDDFISKPIRPKLMLETIQKLLGQASKKETENSTTNFHDQLQMEQTLNEEVVKKLLKYNSPENIREVYEDFILEIERLTGDIKQLIDSGNFKEIGEKLHIIKGNSGTLGAIDLYNFSQGFEKNIKKGNFENTPQEYLSLKRLLDTFKITCQTSEYLNP